MEYIYAALLLHKAGKEISEDALKKVLEAAGIEVDEARIKALVSALKDVNIEEAIANAQIATVAAPAAAPAAGGEEKKEEKKEEDDSKKEEEAAAGLAALFG